MVLICNILPSTDFDDNIEPLVDGEDEEDGDAHEKDYEGDNGGGGGGSSNVAADAQKEEEDVQEEEEEE